MTNLDSILKIRDITLPTKVHLVKAMVFPVVMYGVAKSRTRLSNLTELNWSSKMSKVNIDSSKTKKKQRRVTGLITVE